MLDFFRNLWTADFMPHGQCYLWQPDILWLHVGSDLLITLSYYSIPLALAYFVRKRTDLEFKWIFVLFGVFIFACGTTHLANIWTVWEGTYRLTGTLKLGTGIISAATALLLWPLVPRALRLPSPAQLAREKAAHAEHLQQLNFFFDHSPNLLFVLSTSGQLLRANPAAENALGTSTLQSVSELLQSVHPDNMDVLETALKTVTESSSPVDLDIRIKALDGTFRWYTWDFSPATDQGHFFVTAHDITARMLQQATLEQHQEKLEALVQERTEALASSHNQLEQEVQERRHAEQALRRSESQLKALLDAIPDLMFRIREDGTLLDYKAPLNRILDLEPAHIVGHPILDTPLPEKVKRSTLHHLSKAIAAHEVQQFEYEVELGGTRRSCFEERIVASGPDEAVCIIRDITARSDAEAARARFAAELQRSNQELEQFAYVASHDLQEPLRTITSFVNLIQDRHGEAMEGQMREFFSFIIDATEQMKRLIEDLLAFSRVNTQPLDRVPVDLTKLVKRVKLGLNARIKESGATVTCGPLPRLPVVPTQISAVFQNLISNALKFRGADPPVITIQTTEEDNRWVFSVQDNGIGIKPRYHAQIFEIFKRLHSRRKYEGTGIGLAMCKRIIERHRGSIWVESTYGEGSTFFFSLPKDAA